MIKYLFILGVGALAVGCAASRPMESSTVYGDRPHAQASSSAALVFDPPITAYTPPLNLDRADRVATAYAGYDTVITTVSTTFDDRQYYDNANHGHGGYYGGFGGYVDRQTVIQTVGVRQK